MRLPPLARTILLLSGALLAIGIVSVASAYVHSDGIRRQDFWDDLLRQVLWILVGLWGGAFLMRFPVRRVAPLSYALYGAGLAMLAGVLLFGAQRNGAVRWFRLGPMSLQPSEFAKLFATMAYARFLSWPDRMESAGGFVRVWLLAAAPMGLIYLQPDLTTALLFAPPCFAMLFVSGVPARRWATMGGCLAGLLVILWTCGGIHAYQKSRLTDFARRMGWMSSDARSSARAAEREAYQAVQAQIAIGSGRIFGKGFLRGTQSEMSVIPMGSSDFIFAVIAEEWGLVGSLGLLALYGGLLWAVFRAGAECLDPFGRLFCIGWGSLLAAQVILNVGMACGMGPVVGIPLPLVSAGGSSMISTLLGLALVLRIAASRGEEA